jgi:hypothetical protein
VLAFERADRFHLTRLACLDRAEVSAAEQTALPVWH